MIYTPPLRQASATALGENVGKSEIHLVSVEVKA